MRGTSPSPPAFDVSAHLAAIVESSDDAIISKDLDDTILSWNAGAERLYGHGRRDAIGRPIWLIVPDDLQGEVTALLAEVAAGRKVDHHDTRRVRKDGRIVEVSLTISPVCSTDGTITGASVIARDISDRKRVERRLLQLASEDQLTGLANRRAFLRHLERHLETWIAGGALLAIDLDRFKAINDTLGHGAGDQVLKQTAARLRRVLRPGDVLARLGGDEFAVLLHGVGASEAATAADAVAAELARQEITIGGARCATGSVGWALIEEHLGADELMIRADLAAYDAKQSGDCRACGYEPAHDSRFAEAIDLSLLLGPAL